MFTASVPAVNHAPPTSPPPFADEKICPQSCSLASVITGKSSEADSNLHARLRGSDLSQMRLDVHARAQQKARRRGRRLISPEISRTAVEPEPPLLAAGGGARPAVAVATSEPGGLSPIVFPITEAAAAVGAPCSHDSLMKANCCAAAMLTSMLAAARWFYPPLSFFFTSVGAFF